MSPEERLAERGLVLPELRRPAGNYRGWMRAGDLLYLSGQGADGHTGRLGADLAVIEGYAAARACALNLLAQARDALGALDAVAQVVQVRGFVACTPEFTDQPGVIDGTSAGDSPNSVSPVGATLVFVKMAASGDLEMLPLRGQH